MLSPLAGQIEYYMDLLSARQKLVSSNIANAATPGYLTKDIDFQFEFHSAMEGAGPDSKVEHGLKARPHVIEAPGLKAANDGNNVSLDRESRLLSEIALRFNVASQLWKAQHRVMKSAIQESRNG